MDSIALFWFRRDLRLDDNVGLYHSIKNETKVLPIFIFDTDILDRLSKEDPRVCFLHQRIEELNQQLDEWNKKIHVYHGKPIDVLRKVLSKNTVHAVYTNRDYEPYATQRDVEIKALLSENDVTFSTYKDHVIFERDEVVKSDGSPYRVYTPYSRVWLDKFDRQENLKSYRIDDFKNLTTLADHKNPNLTEPFMHKVRELVPHLPSYITTYNLTLSSILWSTMVIYGAYKSQKNINWLYLSAIGIFFKSGNL